MTATNLQAMIFYGASEAREDLKEMRWTVPCTCFLLGIRQSETLGDVRIPKVFDE